VAVTKTRGRSSETKGETIKKEKTEKKDHQKNTKGKEEIIGFCQAVFVVATVGSSNQARKNRKPQLPQERIVK